MGQCERHLKGVLAGLQAQQYNHKLGWGRLKAAMLSKKTQDSIVQLRRQCNILYKFLVLDTASLATETHLEVKRIRTDHQEWHTIEENDKILQWLSRLSFTEKQQDILSKLHPGTGQCLPESDKFRLGGMCSLIPLLIHGALAYVSASHFAALRHYE